MYKKTIKNRLAISIFKHKLISKALYPILKIGRRILLIILGKKLIWFKKMINKSIFFLSFVLIIFYILNGLPYEETPSNYSLFLSIFRILYFTIFIIFSYKLKNLAQIQYGNNYNEIVMK